MEIKKLTCGLIMPISSTDGCTEQHWSEIKEILSDAVTSIEEYDFEVNMVSHSDDVGVIQKRIVQNVYSSDIVICDVSTKNPNVMFELGLRLAFDKPTIIVKDDKTNYSFDTSIIEHLEYPRDLRFNSIVSFKDKLAKKIVATYEESLRNPEHSTFLKNFGKFTVAKLNEREVTLDKAVLEMLNELQQDVSILKRNSQRINHSLKNKDISEVLPKAKIAIQAYLDAAQLEKVSDIQDEDKEEFFKFIEEHVDARHYFNSPRTFKRFIDEVLERWY
ncbi:hypothetical protein ORM92_03160 [Bacillus cereus]|uniref:RNA helicase n=1 Tax=Bacillus cereus TaxID=1396 RepID=UPI000BFA0292|nr:RNA helicase [Bacillus cereus]MDZ4530158.1 hypothetical protein [Bacillus cereus]PFK82537.1 RNA helicase [Bacillus cereus]HDZ3280974.1 hypothetical protein [Bacillus cereus]